jgi:hypothetical protein
LVDGRKKESRLKGYNSLERMEVGRDSVGSLKSYKNFINPLGFGSITFY